VVDPAPLISEMTLTTKLVPPTNQLENLKRLHDSKVTGLDFRPWWIGVSRNTFGPYLGTLTAAS
jgi:hypothetical protein